jgi:NAD(P)-dependent dehydrogenase (short-subunit alcohol dehydrogenase family)
MNVPSPNLSSEMSSALQGRVLGGKTILLTGAGGGIGRAIAEALTCSGATLIAVDLPGSPVSQVTAELVAAGNVAHAYEGDVAMPGALDALVSEFEQIDGVINCAGLWKPAPFDQLDEDTLAETVRGNLVTAFEVCRSVLPLMAAQGFGSIVNFASTAGEYGSISPAAHYAAAKAGVIGLTKSLAREAARWTVRVNAVSPGPVDTVALGAATPEARAAAAARTLFNRLGRPDEVAGACVFLVSPLSTFVTGHVLRVNGGSLL